MNEPALMRMMVSLLAVVAMALGMLHQEVWLIGGAVMLLLGIFGSMGDFLKKKAGMADESTSGPGPREPSRDEELRNLGIMEIRPKKNPPDEEAPPFMDDRTKPPTSSEMRTAKARPASSGSDTTTARPGSSGADTSKAQPTSSGSDAPKARPKKTDAAPAQPSAPSAETKTAEEAPGKEDSAAASATAPASPSRAQSSPAAGEVSAREKRKREKQDHATVPETRDREKERREAPEDTSFEATVLTTCLSALRAVLDANSVCLLKQEELALQYQIIAADGTGVGGGSFSTESPLVTANMTRRSVTVQRVGNQALAVDNLGYYEGETPAIRQVMLAPVRYVREPVTCFLLADTTRAGGFNGQRPRDLISQFASLISGLLEDEANRSSRPSEDVRPRRELIQEAIDGAHREDEPFALVLVYLNRAEALASEGEAAIMEAEEELEKRLAEDISREQVVRFGELTYGVFYQGDITKLESWAAALQHELAGGDGMLEGGVSIGMALLGPDNEDPERLRADATRALREAYETGECVLLS